MELATIEMPKEQAVAAFQEYRHAVRSAKTATVNSEDAQIARAYKALADGKQVLDINEAFLKAGHDDKGLPRLAISRADYKTVQLNLLTEWHWENGHPQERATNFEIWPSREIRIRVNTNRDGQIFIVGLGNVVPADLRLRHYAIVPNIPPHLRPPFDLKNYHLLWEPKWEIQPRPPGDPALLKHLGGSLYAVLAIWDLTPVEQAILSITRTR